MPKTNDKTLAIKSFIVNWLKDPTEYCNNCGQNYHPNLYPCCDNPQRGNNKIYLQALVMQNAEKKKHLANQYAANKTMTMRHGVSILPRLLEDLETYFRINYNEKLWNDDKELKSFMRSFPMFCIPDKI